MVDGRSFNLPCKRYCHFRAGPDGADDRHSAAEPVYAFAYPLQAEVPLQNAGMVFGIEAASIIRDGKEKMFRLKAASDLDGLGVSVPDGVLHQFADDSEKGVSGVVGEPFARDVEAHGK